MRQEGVAEALTADAHFRQTGFIALLLEKNKDAPNARSNSP
jgi:hypothetical protein